jgi:hypothetical protein
MDLVLFHGCYIQWRGLGTETKVWDLFSNFTIEKPKAVFIWSPLKYTPNR